MAVTYIAQNYSLLLRACGVRPEPQDPYRPTLVPWAIRETTLSSLVGHTFRLLVLQRRASIRELRRQQMQKIYY